MDPSILISLAVAWSTARRVMYGSTAMRASISSSGLTWPPMSSAAPIAMSSRLTKVPLPTRRSISPSVSRLKRTLRIVLRAVSNRAASSRSAGSWSAVDVETAADGLAQLGGDITDVAAVVAEARAGGRSGLLSGRAFIGHGAILSTFPQTTFLCQLVDIGVIGLQLVMQLCKVAAVQSSWVVRPRP